MFIREGILPNTSYFKMKNYKLLLAFTLWICIGTNVKAQINPQVRIIARADSVGKIHLRWAATNSSTWKRCNKYGFRLERYTIIRDKQLLEKPECKQIGGIIKPKPLNEWKTLAEKNNYAAILAQALYGKDFAVSNTEIKGITHIIAQSQEQEQRFSFSLYAADMSFDAAGLAGWGLIDWETRRNEKYLYRIITAAPTRELKTDTASVFISPAEYEPLPMIEDVAAQFGNRTVMLSWDCGRLASYYTSYYVSKSIDGGKTFKRLEGVPVTNFNSRADQSSQRMYLMDSLSNNLMEYQYRVCGISSFGQEGPCSVPVVGHGRELLAFAPSIETAFVDDRGVLQFQWLFEEEGNTLIKGFVINRSDRAGGGYQIFTDTLGAKLRRLNLKKVVEETNYFTITAVPYHGESRTSFPVLVQTIDSIPPSIPSGLKAIIDTSGVVTLSWNPNTERDFFGYKVFQALKEGEDLVPLTDSVWFSNTFLDKLNLNLLNRKVWYGISALDKHYNQSAVSALIEVKKPSRIPPSPAVITRYEIKGDSLQLYWVNSTDGDVKIHSLHRKGPDDEFFVKLIEYSGQSRTSYTDVALQGGKSYAYYIQVQNEAELVTISEPLELSISAKSEFKKEIARLFAYSQKEQKRIQVVWDDQLSDVVEYQLYRAPNGQPLVSWQSVNPLQKGVYDTEVSAGEVYEYGIVAVLKSGRYSAMKRITAKL